jgi:hypothetical protein
VLTQTTQTPLSTPPIKSYLSSPRIHINKVSRGKALNSLNDLSNTNPITNSYSTVHNESKAKCADPAKHINTARRSSAYQSKRNSQDNTLQAQKIKDFKMNKTAYLQFLCSNLTKEFKLVNKL